jgi:hypothetical protein
MGVEQSVMECIVKALCYVKSLVRNPRLTLCASREGSRVGMPGGYSGSSRITLGRDLKNRLLLYSLRA